MKHVKLAKDEEGIPLSQGSEKWLQYRSGGKIGATSFANLLASKGITKNPWGGGVLEDIIAEVYRLLNPPKYKSTYKHPAMLTGNILEPKIKQEVIFKEGILALPYTLEYIDNPRIYSSYDALDLSNKFLWEIKTTKNITEMDEFLTKFYLGQVIHELMVVHGGNVPNGNVAKLIILDKRSCTNLSYIHSHLYVSHINHKDGNFTASSFRPHICVPEESETPVADIYMTKEMWLGYCQEYLGLYDQVMASMNGTVEEPKSIEAINLIKQAGSKASKDLMFAVQSAVFMENSEEKAIIINLLIDKLKQVEV